MRVLQHFFLFTSISNFLVFWSQGKKTKRGKKTRRGKKTKKKERKQKKGKKTKKKTKQNEERKQKRKENKKITKQECFSHAADNSMGIPTPMYMCLSMNK